MKKRQTALTHIAVIILIISVLFTFSGCRDGGAGNIIRQQVWIDSGHDTWIRAEVMTPEKPADGKLPLVTIGHGFRGNMNSAGGAYLSESLAEAGFAVIRMDYAYYTDKDTDTMVNQYTVDTMIDTQLACIGYMIENYNADPERIGLYGRSLGGRVAMAMANQSSGGYDYKALALVAPAGTADAFVYYMGGEEAWREMKREADAEGHITHQGVILTPEFFSSMENCVPSENGDSFKNPVLVIYNTEDNVVLPATSMECAAAYENVELVQVTTDKSPHGYEMGFESSELKDELIGRITDFFKASL